MIRSNENKLRVCACVCTRSDKLREKNGTFDVHVGTVARHAGVPGPAAPRATRRFDSRKSFCRVARLIWNLWSFHLRLYVFAHSTLVIAENHCALRVTVFLNLIVSFCLPRRHVELPLLPDHRSCKFRLGVGPLEATQDTTHGRRDGLNHRHSEPRSTLVVAERKLCTLSQTVYHRGANASKIVRARA